MRGAGDDEGIVGNILLFERTKPSRERYDVMISPVSLQAGVQSTPASSEV